LFRFCKGSENREKYKEKSDFSFISEMNPTFSKGERYKKNRDFQIFPVKFRENLQSAPESARVASRVCKYAYTLPSTYTLKSKQLVLVS